MKPHPATVDSVTAAGIVGLFNITPIPEVAFQSDWTCASGIVAVIAAVLLVIVAGVPLNVIDSITFASPPLPPAILIFPEPNKDSLLIVFIFVPETSVFCFPLTTFCIVEAVDEFVPLYDPTPYTYTSPFCIISKAFLRAVEVPIPTEWIVLPVLPNVVDALLETLYCPSACSTLLFATV